ncbi:hypothetical protein PS691_00863 [Pseudomonas fluorescens]|uniref:Uncharacterized protein n=1 Tax=Pseudomonas fluorescens TaxID=294 RepID=A0A5E7AFS3_PSEFL|nr:hypothetical protein PS691_00863 [Pseudomonas fluorescens]
MFNLLVSAGGWGDRRGTMPLGRMLNMTVDSAVDFYRPKGALDLARLILLPALIR